MIIEISGVRYHIGPPPPCYKRITIKVCAYGAGIEGYCHLPMGHEGDCVENPPRVKEEKDEPKS